MEPNPRYAGRPLVRLLECYVLWAIGELAPRDADLLHGMTPKLQSLYGSDEPWQDIVAATADMGPQMPARLKDLWSRNGEIAREAGVPLTPQQFAEMIVDENFIGPDGSPP